MNDVKMFVSDSHTGILHAISEHYPNSPWQRCQTHFSRNILSKTPSKYQKGLAAELSEMYNEWGCDDAKIILAYSDYFKLTGSPSLIPRYALGNW